MTIEGCAKLIKDYRKHLKLTQSEFGKLIGYQKSAVSKMEAGDKNITIQKFLTILDKLKITYSYKVELL